MTELLRCPVFDCDADEEHRDACRFERYCPLRTAILQRDRDEMYAGLTPSERMVQDALDFRAPVLRSHRRGGGYR